MIFDVVPGLYRLYPALAVNPLATVANPKNIVGVATCTAKAVRAEPPVYPSEKSVAVMVTEGAVLIEGN